jgi:hypothetical protein
MSDKKNTVFAITDGEMSSRGNNTYVVTRESTHRNLQLVSLNYNTLFFRTQAAAWEWCADAMRCRGNASRKLAVMEVELSLIGAV